MESNDEGVSLADVTVINDMETQSNTVVDTENSLDVYKRQTLHKTVLRMCEPNENFVSLTTSCLATSHRDLSVQFTSSCL